MKDILQDGMKFISNTQKNCCHISYTKLLLVLQLFHKWRAVRDGWVCISMFSKRHKKRIHQSSKHVYLFKPYFRFYFFFFLNLAFRWTCCLLKTIYLFCVRAGVPTNDPSNSLAKLIAIQLVKLNWHPVTAAGDGSVPFGGAPRLTAPLLPTVRRARLGLWMTTCL